MAATDTDSVHDHMTRLRMKMVQQVRELLENSSSKYIETSKYRHDY